jgi:tellurite resistance protein
MPGFTGKKGWLTNYLEFRKDIFLSFFEDTAGDTHPDHSLYRLLQPKGLMYGHPIIDKHEADEFADVGEMDKMKLLMAESLINGSIIFHHQDINTEKDFSDIIMKTVHSIGDFYNNVYPELSVPAHSFLGKKKSPLEIAEKILEKRVMATEKGESDFWAMFFNNSLLFLDIYFFGQWMHTGSDKAVAEFFKQERETLRFSVVKVFAAAAHANGNIEPQEKSLFEYFLESSQLSAKQKTEAQDIFAKGVEIKDIYLPTQNSWILKKYFLELAILTVWADRKLEKSEKEFLDRFNASLGFFDDDLENSLLAVEGFVLENWKQLEDLQGEKEYDDVSQSYLDKIQNMADKNAKRLAAEMNSNTRLVTLMNKSSKENLSEEEEEELRVGIMKVLKSVPTFVIIGLPSTFLTLPMLLKILPEHPGPE